MIHDLFGDVWHGQLILFPLVSYVSFHRNSLGFQKPIQFRKLPISPGTNNVWEHRWEPTKAPGSQIINAPGSQIIRAS